MSEWKIHVGLTLMFALGYGSGWLHEHSKRMKYWRDGFDDAKKIYKPKLIPRQSWRQVNLFSDFS